MKLLLGYAGILICAVLLLGGCIPFDDYHYHYHYESRDPVHHGHYDHHGDYDDHNSGQHDDHGSGQHDEHGSGQHDEHGSGQHNGHGSGQQDNHGSGQHGDHNSAGRDDGERAIMSFVEEHAVPVSITRIEHLPALTRSAAPGTATPELARYKVSMVTTESPKITVVQVVDYNPGTGELALEP